MADLFTANLSALLSSLVETDAETNIFTINLINGDPVATSRTINVPYVLTGTALQGTDYEILTGSVDITIGANATSGTATITIAPRDDVDFEGTETVTVTLASPVGDPPLYVFGTQVSTTIAITDPEDADPTALSQISVVADRDAAEQGIITTSFTL